MIGVTVGIGKRLSWPDDYFTFQAEIGYQWYYLKNWDYLYYMNNGTSNSLTLGLTLARQSIDNPLYTRSGSIFSLNLQLTPPLLFLARKTGNVSPKRATTALSRPRRNSTDGLNTGSSASRAVPTLRLPTLQENGLS